MVHNDKVKSLQHGQMVENAHRKTTNIDEDDAPHPIPSPTSPLPLARMGQMKLARHCYVTTMWKQNLFIGLTATHSLEKRKKQRGASLPLERARQEEPGGGEGGVEECSAALVVRLYCAPLVGFCRQGATVSTVVPIISLGQACIELTWLLLAPFPHQADKRVDSMPFKEQTANWKFQLYWCIVAGQRNVQYTPVNHSNGP